MKEMDYFENLGLYGRRILKRIMNEHDAVVEAAFICIELMTVDRLLLVW